MYQACVTLFVSNLSEKIHWKGLFQSFGKYGDVIDAFIPQKRSKSGRRFGFVRFSNMWDARRAMDRLDDFNLFGSRIRVSFARYNSRRSYWRKVRPPTDSRAPRNNMQNLENSQGGNSRGDGVHPRTVTASESNVPRVSIQGVAEVARIEALRNCVVGWCKLEHTMEDLAKEMFAAGLSGFSIMRLAGSIVLMIFEDSAKLETTLKDQCDLLDYWFLRKEKWSDKLQTFSRRVWLSCYGIPLHAWGVDTFRNIAKNWGTFIDIGENTRVPKSFTKGNVLIVTEKLQRIDEIIDLKVGDRIFPIRVVESELIDLRYSFHENGYQYDSSSEGVSVSSPVEIGDRRTTAVGGRTVSHCDESTPDLSSSGATGMMSKARIEESQGFGMINYGVSLEVREVPDATGAAGVVIAEMHDKEIEGSLVGEIVSDSTDDSGGSFGSDIMVIPGDKVAIFDDRLGSNLNLDLDSRDFGEEGRVLGGPDAARDMGFNFLGQGDSDRPSFYENIDHEKNLVNGAIFGNGLEEGLDPLSYEDEIVTAQIQDLGDNSDGDYDVPLIEDRLRKDLKWKRMADLEDCLLGKIQEKRKGRKSNKAKKGKQVCDSEQSSSKIAGASLTDSDLRRCSNRQWSKVKSQEAIMDEAEATWNLGKGCGLHAVDGENTVLQKIVELQNKNKKQ